MRGASWTERQPSDWLASNGRWYPASKYPRGWRTSSLPPAPGHGGADSILLKYATTAITSVGANDSMGSPARPTAHAGAGTAHAASPPPKHRTTGGDVASASAPGFSVARSGRSVADATVTGQRTHAQRVEAGAPPPPALSSAGTIPKSPGRVRDDAPIHAPGSQVGDPPPPPSVFDQVDSPSTEVEVLAGDLGKVFGSAKKRIEKALNDSFEA